MIAEDKSLPGICKRIPGCFHEGVLNLSENGITSATGFPRRIRTIVSPCSTSVMKPDALLRKSVNAIVVGGIGAGAINKLNAQGVKVYRAFKGTVKTNLTYFENGSMPQFTLDHACGGHGGGCSH